MSRYNRRYPSSKRPDGPLPFPSNRDSPRNSQSTSSVSRPPTRHASSPAFASLPQFPTSSGSSAEPADTTGDLRVVQKYFSSLRTTADFQFEEHRTPQSVRGGGIQQYFIAHVEVPTPAGSPIVLTAEGTNKKTARQNLLRMVRDHIEREGWLAAAEGAKRPRRDGSHQHSVRSRAPPGPRQRQPPPETWERMPVKPIPTQPIVQLSFLRDSRAPVKSAWDDDEDQVSWASHPAITPALGTTQPSASWGRSTWDDDSPTYRPNSSYQQQRSHRPEPVSSQHDEPLSHYYGSQLRDDDWSTPLHGERWGDLEAPNVRGIRAGSSSWRSGGSSTHDYRQAPSRDYFSRSSMQQQPEYQQHHVHRAEPEYLRPPSPKANLPDDVDDAEKKLIAFYCNGNKLAVPKPVLRHLPQKRHEQGRWEVRLRLAAHVFEGRDVQPITAVGHGKSKKVATVKAWNHLCAHLLAIVSQQYIDAFRLLSIPLKKRLQTLLAQPIRVELTESTLTRLDNMLSQLKEVDAFQFEEHLVDSGAVEASLGFGNEPGLSGQPPYRDFRGPSRRLRPIDIPIPRELEKNELPIFTQYREIICAIENNPVTILSAETGAGKTTQLPQFILAHFKQQRAMATMEQLPTPANVVVTQPRRIAAISVAQRVAYERGEVLGRESAIGYQVRFDDKRPTADPRDGHIVFCTSGILLKRLQEDPQLKNVTHIILDEVHERDLNTDLLLIIVRQLLHKRPDIRVVLMSATAETQLFQDYFVGFGTEGPQNAPPIISVPGRMFPVEQYFLEDVDALLRDPRALPVPFRPCKESLHWVSNETGPLISPRGEDPMPYDYFEALIAHICTTREDGAILCFLPGWQEIDVLMQRLKDDDNFRVGFADESRFRIFPLHSSIPTSAQQLIFETPPKGVRKIILSTNIAETSVTINDVVYVLDSGKIRINSYDADRRISSLSSVWASLSNLRQRSGRAGRCRPGMYFSVLSHRRKAKLSYSMPPELLRVDLQSTVLKVKALRLARHCADVFSHAPQPPSPVNVSRALQELRTLGAINADENLTTLGHVLSKMPVDPWIGKMVIEAAMLGCLDPILTIAGGMEIGRGIFSIHPEEKEKGRAHILTKFAVGTESDHLTMLNAFRAWKEVADAHGGSHRSFIPQAKDFARANFLHYNSMTNIERARQQLLRNLEDAGLVDKRSRFRADFDRSSADDKMGGADYNTFASNTSMVRAILCGALYPNVAEVAGKDEYYSRTDSKLRLTGSSVNSWKGVVNSAGQPARGQAGVNSGRGTPAGSTATSDVFDYDNIPDDDDDSTLDDISNSATVPPLPPRLLSFQEKQRVDMGLYLRNTTRVDPIALVLFADPGSVKPATAGAPGFLIDAWVRVNVSSVHEMRVLIELKEWLHKYLQWAIWSRQQSRHRYGRREEQVIRANWNTLGKMLVRELASVVEFGSSEPRV
ncbi:hypothetical protein SpCBS45565_g02690 [Spizellomyces sp. 'palustris']|nr:hypothetical protein SpCBS45565_g02690 [Spizellomyces sp. 'palustris']